MNIVDDIIAYENGEMDFDQVVEFFQKMIGTGFVWNLQGSYVRTANDLIREGYCEKGRK